MFSSNEGSAWCVVIAKPNMCDDARINIGRLGYRVEFLLTRQLRERRELVGGRRLRRKVEISTPLFAPYGFVLLRYGVDAYDIDNAVGVHKLLRHAPLEGDRIGRPKRIRASIVDAFCHACVSGEFDDAALKPKPELRQDLKPGDKVRRRDRMDGIVVTVRQLSEDGRIRYFNEMLGGSEGWFSRKDAVELELVDA